MIQALETIFGIAMLSMAAYFLHLFLVTNFG